MAIRQRRFGEIVLTSIMDIESELAFAELFDEQMPPPVAMSELPRVHPSDYTATGWRFRCRCFLVQGPDAIVLVDLGVGHAGSRASSWIETPGHLMEELKGIAIEPGDVDHVVITHHHDDHTGWATVEPDGQPVPTFTNAVYHLHLADLLPLKDGAEPEMRALYTQVLEPLERTGQLRATETEDRVARGIQLVNTPGHTAGHRCVMLSAAGQEVLIAGDLLHFTHQLDDGGWRSPLDEDPDRAIRTRAEVLARAQKDGAVIASTHLPHDFCQIVDGPDGRTLEER
jgi:glyoxylase-like metal-dependent hydrolase (beta-lactamase superfamily II)